MKFKHTLITIVVLMALVATCRAATFKPFVRSRYSLRWRKTTEFPKTMDSTTTAPQPPMGPTVDPVKAMDKAENLQSKTTDQATTKTSTHVPDYDYYGNHEMEDNDRTLNITN
ncbi:uncharacterized protein LOC106080631 [Stomoxys calcitrans]|uniref:Uncharacterized protein n=1 Tax=Stomoxys calcitrans TaxID=35570 RepID=A0A1I8PH51_STOCA|nr:uncharacterized protein LOC106080631 [Stomoxys calcitrans]